MKRFLFPLLTLSLLATAQARTWTSANGKDFFSGIYLRSDATTVTVSIAGKEGTLKLNLISEEDQKWAAAEEKRLTNDEKKAAPEKPTLETQFIGKKLKGKTSHVVGDKFAPKDTNKVPDYYYFYYSASW